MVCIEVAAMLRLCMWVLGQRLHLTCPGLSIQPHPMSLSAYRTSCPVVCAVRQAGDSGTHPTTSSTGSNSLVGVRVVVVVLDAPGLKRVDEGREH